MQQRDLSPDPLRLPALLALAGALAGVAAGLVVPAEVPPLLADWPLRAAVIAALHGAGLGGWLWPLAFALVVGGAVVGGVGAWLAWLRLAPATAAAGGSAVTSVVTSGAKVAGTSEHRLPAKIGRRVVVWSALLALMPLATPPLFSSDAFLYAFYGKVQAVHGDNPYRLPLKSFARSCALPQAPHLAATPGRPCRHDGHCPPPSGCLVDPFVPYQAWLEVRAAYGPLALALFRLAYVEALPPAANAWILRFLAAMAMLAVVALLARQRGAGAAALVGFAPLSAQTAGNGGHLEPWICLALLALLFDRPRPAGRAALRLGLGTAALALSKLPLAVLALPALVAGWAAPIAAPAGRRVAVTAAALALAVIAGAYAAFWCDPHPFVGIAEVGATTIRAPLDVWRRIDGRLGGEGDLTVARVVAALAALALAAPLLRRAAADLVGATLALWLVLTALGSGIFHPWYALPGLVLVALAGHRARASRSGRATLWLALAAPAVVPGAWIWLGAEAFAWPGVLAPTALLWVPVLAVVVSRRPPADLATPRR